MIVYKCDRCEKEIEYPKYIYLPGPVNWSNKIIDGQYMIQRMVCNQCLLSLANWIDDNFIYNEYNKMNQKENKEWHMN